MVDLLSLLDNLLEKLDAMYYAVEDADKRGDIRAYYNKLSHFQQELAKKAFAKNDQFYTQAMLGLKKAQSTLSKLNTKLDKTTEFFTLISQITKELDTLIAKII